MDVENETDLTVGLVDPPAGLSVGAYVGSRTYTYGRRSTATRLAGGHHRTPGHSESSPAGRMA